MKSNIASSGVVTPIVIFMLVSLLWWGSFLSLGVWDYCDALKYSANGISMARTGQKFVQPVQWDDFSSGEYTFGKIKGYANDLYSVILAGIYKITGNARVWYGSLLSYFFFVFGSLFLWKIFQRFLSFWPALLCFSLSVTHSLVLQTMIRPLTDPLFWGLSMFLMWFISKWPRRVCWIGFIVGCITLIRFQAVFYFPLLLLFTMNKRSLREFFLRSFQIALGALLPLGFFILIKGFGMGETSQVSSESFFYFDFFFRSLSSGGFRQGLFAINDSFMAIFSVFVFGFSFCFFVASLCFPSSETYLYRLRWFTFLGVMTLIAVFPFVAKKIVVVRYFCVYIPFVILTVWTFVSDLLSHFDLNKKTISWLMAFGLCVNFFVGPVRFFVRLPDMSWRNIPLADFSSFEKNMAQFSGNSVIATNNPWRMMLHHPSRNLLYLAENPEGFQRKSRENRKIDAIALFGPPKACYEGKILLPEGYESWAGLWGSEVLSDDSGNRFEKIYEEKSPSMQMFIYRRQFGE